MRKWTPAIPIAAAVALSALTYRQIPDPATIDLSPLLPVSTPTGEPMPRFFIALFLPALAALLWLFIGKLASVRRGRPPIPEWLLNESTGKSSVDEFAPTFTTIVFGVVSLICLMHVGLLAGALGWPAVTFQFLTAMLGIGFIAVGNVLPRTRPNWIVGLRTKRALADRTVWLRTHRIAGGLMIATGAVVILMSILAPRYALVGAFGLLLASFPVAVLLASRAPEAA